MWHGERRKGGAKYFSGPTKLKKGRDKIRWLFGKISINFNWFKFLVALFRAPKKKLDQSRMKKRKREGKGRTGGERGGGGVERQ